MKIKSRKDKKPDEDDDGMPPIPPAAQWPFPTGQKEQQGGTPVPQPNSPNDEDVLEKTTRGVVVDHNWVEFEWDEDLNSGLTPATS